MTPGREESCLRRRVRRAVAVGVLVSALACAPGCTRSLAERAVAARGGPLTTLARDVEADVHRGFPGTWRWHVDQRTPDLLRWTLETYGEEQTFSWDGEQVRFFLGSAALPPDPAAAADFRSIVRWSAVTALALVGGGPAVEVAEIPAGELPSRIEAGLRVRYRDDGATYDLYFDERDLLVAARGPVSIPTVGAGELYARYSAFREVGGFVLPYDARYTLGGDPLFEERIRRWVPNDPALDVESFRRAPPRLAR